MGLGDLGVGALRWGRVADPEGIGLGRSHRARAAPPCAAAGTTGVPRLEPLTSSRVRRWLVGRDRRCARHRVLAWFIFVQAARRRGMVAFHVIRQCLTFSTRFGRGCSCCAWRGSLSLAQRRTRSAIRNCDLILVLAAEVDCRARHLCRTDAAQRHAKPSSTTRNSPNQRIAGLASRKGDRTAAAAHASFRAPVPRRRRAAILGAIETSLRIGSAPWKRLIPCKAI